MRLVISLKAPRLLVPPPEAPPTLWWLTRFQRQCYRFVTWAYFEQVVGWLVLLNIAVMCLKHKQQGDVFSNVEDGANIAFTVAFTIEAGVLIAGMGPRQYFERPWNCFDFVLVLGSIISVAVNQRCVVGAALMSTQVYAHTSVLPRSSSVGIMLRMFRILRVFRLVRLSSALKQLGRLLIFSLPSFFNIMLILCEGGAPCESLRRIVHH